MVVKQPQFTRVKGVGIVMQSNEMHGFRRPHSDARTGKCLEAKEIDEACRIAVEAFSQNRYDFPFALFYLPAEDRRRAQLVANVGLNPGQRASPEDIELTEVNASGLWPIALAFETNSVQQVDNLEQK